MVSEFFILRPEFFNFSQGALSIQFACTNVTQDLPYITEEAFSVFCVCCFQP